MPFYDYKCGQCGKTFEVLHGMSGMPAGLTCDFCGSADIRRVFHPVGMVRGGGDFSDTCSSCSSGSCSSCH